MSAPVSFAALQIAVATQVQLRTGVDYDRALELAQAALPSGTAIVPPSADRVLVMAHKAIDKAVARAAEDPP